MSLSIEGETTPAPIHSRLLWPAAKQALRGRAAHSEAEAKTTIDSTTQHAQNSQKALPARLSNLPL
jgi:hypothetical protein